MLARGLRLGQYEVLEPLGAGGMGEVYRARDARLGRDVALKVLLERAKLDADRLARFEREVLMLSGEFDAMIPVENARRYFELIGVPPSDKRHVIAVGGHYIPRDLLIRETLDWLDRHLGPARR
jgi:serine/threonine protein kinase